VLCGCSDYRKRALDAGWENDHLRAWQRGQQGRHIGKSAKPDKNAEAAGVGDKRERRWKAIARRCWLQRGRLRRSASFAGRKECCLAREETSLDGACRW